MVVLNVHSFFSLLFHSVLFTLFKLQNIPLIFYLFTCHNMTEKVLVDEQQLTPQLSEDVDRSQVMDSDSRVELLERNLRYIQQQHEITLNDLHNEINRLQQENKDLHYRLINSHSLEQEQQINDPIPTKSLDDMKENQLHLEAKIVELENQLIESDENNKYLLNKITELNKQLLSSKSETFESSDNQISNDSDYQNLISTLHEKQEQYLQEVNKLLISLISFF
jgi:hypothetical protein